MAETTRLTAKLLDGRELKTDTTTFMCAADRIAFERYYKMGTAALTEFRDLWDENGTPRPGADMTKLHEEWSVFFVWRALRRAVDGQLPEDFDGFCDLIEELEVEGGAGNPTTDAPPSTS
jgi:hypothetical protein